MSKHRPTEVERAVQALADVMLSIDTENVWEHFTCTEAEAIATLFRVANREDAAQHIITLHAVDDDEGDEHHNLKP